MLSESDKTDLAKNDDIYLAQNSRDSVKKVAWICTAIAVCVGLIITKNPACLWAFALTLFL